MLHHNIKLFCPCPVVSSLQRFPRGFPGKCQLTRNHLLRIKDVRSLARVLREEAMAREVEERKRREEEARFMAEQQRLRDEAQRAQEEKEAQQRAKAEQEENERLQRQVSEQETRASLLFVMAGDWYPW